MATASKIAKTAAKTGLRRAAGAAGAFLGGPIGLGITALMWLPDLLSLMGWGVDKLRGTGLGKELLGVSDEELIKQIKTETKRLEGRDALAVYQEDQILQRREQARESFAYNQVGREAGIQISDLQQQIDALKTDPTLQKPSEESPEAIALDTPTASDALRADEGALDRQAEGAEAAPDGPAGLLSEDEAEDMRATLIEVGLPAPEPEVF